ncbi:primosomal protein N' [soil metagenome]
MIKLDPLTTPAETFYVDVVLPLALPDLYTYSVSNDLAERILPGQRVVVQFGKHKVYSALIIHLHQKPPANYQTKQVLELIDESPVINSEQFKLWQWIADYYLCTLGEVMIAAFPSALRLQSETIIIRDENFEGDPADFSDREYLIWEALELKPALTIGEISKIVSLKQVMPLVKGLMTKRAIMVQEEMMDKYKPRWMDIVFLNPIYLEDAAMGKLMDQLEKRSPRQNDLLLTYINLSRDFNKKKIAKNYLVKKAGVTPAIMQSLLKKEVFLAEKQQVDRLAPYSGEVIPPKTLNPYQVQSLKEIKVAFEAKKVALLHGVTSSGKTELYVHLMQEVLDQGKQVLYLLPEIGLTTQIISRLQLHFGNRILIYHSRFNDQERVEAWNKVLDDNLTSGAQAGKIVIGARSALFLPFTKLGLVIVDEEHDQSYKQMDPAPRYNARDAAVVLGARQQANVLLGSATPGMESYFNALTGKYALVTLNKRHAELEMPEVFIVDLKDARRKKQVSGNFSKILLDHIRVAVENKDQVILFQNRRGFAPFLECNVCSWVPVCVNCDVALTYHKNKNELKCHYCGYLIAPPAKCGACGDHDLRMKGFGTERIEEDLQLLIPEARIARLDYDTTRSKTAYSKILGSFEEGEIDVLVGTQMVTKGLDFERVSLVGILNADSLFHFPDFRSHERGFQLLAQVSGRAGRRQEGKVLVQTYNPSSSVLSYVLRHDFEGFYHHELLERYKFSYPPYFRLIEIRLRHKDEKELDRSTNAFVKELKASFGKRVLGPTTPTVTRVRNFYIRHVLIKLEKTLSVSEVKQRLSQSVDKFKKDPDHRRLLIQIDVDPM